VWHWYSHFKSGQELLEEEPHSRRPSTCANAKTVLKVKELVLANWQITAREVVNEVGISYGSAQAILTEEVQMRWVCSKFVLSFLTQRECWKAIASELFEKSTQDSSF
jgi:hypothetical protein